MRLLQSDDQWVRIQVAVALRDHRRRGLRSVLIAALEDPDELVRYHVEQRLAEIDETSDED
jgi:HEAT repeat protein